MRPHDSSVESPGEQPNRKRKQSVPKKKETAVLRDIRVLQQTSTLLIPKMPFCRLVREIMLNEKDDLRIQGEALSALQESSEMYITQLLEDAFRCTLHRDRITLHPKDIKLVRLLRGAGDPGNR